MGVGAHRCSESGAPGGMSRGRRAGVGVMLCGGYVKGLWGRQAVGGFGVVKRIGESCRVT